LKVLELLKHFYIYYVQEHIQEESPKNSFLYHLNFKVRYKLAFRTIKTIAIKAIKPLMNYHKRFLISF